MFRCAIGFLFLLNLSIASGATLSSAVSEKEFQIYQGLVQAKLETAQASAGKDQLILQTRLDNQDKRLEDEHSRISDISLYLSLFGLLITLAAATLGLIGYFSVRNRAREEARTESKKWFDEEAQSLKQKIGDFEKQLSAQKAKLDQQADQHSAAIQSSTTEFMSLVAAQKQNLQKQMSLSSTEPRPLASTASDAANALDEIASNLRFIPETEYSFDDWDNRAFAAMQAGQLKDAVYFWQRAIEMPNANPLDVARTLLNKSVALGQLGHSEETIVVFDDLLARFGSATELPLREHVAKALINKGITLGQLGRSEEAIMVFDDLLARFGNAAELPLREQIAYALVNKGVALGQLGRSEEEIVAYSDLLTRFGNATELALREGVANALVNKGNVLGQLGRSEEAIVVFDDLLARFGNATELFLREHVARANNGKGFALLCRAKSRWHDIPIRTADLASAASFFATSLIYTADTPLRAIILGNQAYAAALSGETEARVRDLLQQALHLGCETLYQATLKDLDISPVPNDAAFRQLLDAVWSEVKPHCEAGSPV